MAEKPVDREISGMVPHQSMENVILLIRGEKVILDSDLAWLYGVKTKRLNEQVKRNRDRFPDDFMFQLTEQEKSEVVANCDHLSQLRFSVSLPFAFTEHGAIMAASVLNTPRAVEMSIFVVRAFVRLRSLLATHKELALKVAALEKTLVTHDEHIHAIIEAIQQLMAQPTDAKKRKIGHYLTPTRFARSSPRRPQRKRAESFLLGPMRERTAHQANLHRFAREHFSRPVSLTRNSEPATVLASSFCGCINSLLMKELQEGSKIRHAKL